MNDDEHDAWQQHHHGASWEEIGTEMGCSQAAAQSLATAYEKRAYAAARSAQNALFVPVYLQSLSDPQFLTEGQ